MKAEFALLTLLGLTGALVLAEKVRFDNYKVVRVMPHNEAQLETLKMLENENMGFSFWNEPSKVEQAVDVMVPPHLQDSFEDFVSLNGLDSSTFVRNVQELIDNERPSVRQLATKGSIDWNDYYNLTEIYSWLEELAASYPNIVTLVNVGQTYEGRDIIGVRVSFSPANANRSFFIEGGIHAREWISPATVTYILNDILTSTNSTLRAIYESFDFYVFPVFNPDGYQYTFTTNRMWRKTRVPYSILCFGADPNRNWNYQWMTGGSSSIPCSETYAGPYAFSEPSTKAISDYIGTIASRLVGYISFHSYSQLLMLCYGHTSAHLDNYDEIYPIGVKAANSLASRYGTSYQVGNIAEIIYVASGGSTDWVKGTYGTRVTFTYELRDRGEYGFILPASQIIPTALETLDSVITILTETLALK